MFRRMFEAVQSAQQAVSSAVDGVRTDSYAPRDDLVTPELKREFVDRGIIVVPSVVPLARRARALREINRSLGKGPEAAAGSPFASVPKVISSTPELMVHEAITGLLRDTPALGCAHSLLGTATHRVWAGQIALRYPGDGCVPQQVTDAVRAAGPLGAWMGRQALKAAHQNQLAAGKDRGNAEFDEEYLVVPKWHQQWHIDGWPNPLTRPDATAGVENFSLLVGVLLSDVHEPLNGNLTVFPGSHRVIETVIRDMGGPEQLFVPATQPPASLGADVQAESVRRLREAANPRVGPSEQVCARAGDVIIAHYQLAHTIAPNVGPNIRYCIYFRLNSYRHEPKTYRPETLTNIWLDFEGVHEYLGPPTPVWSPATASQPASALATAAQTAAEAKARERDGDPEVAQQLYERAAELLLAALGQTADADVRARVGQAADEALTAAERIKDARRNRPSSAYPGGR